MDKSLLNNIDYINNVFWLLEALIDIYVDAVDLYYIDQEIKQLVSELNMFQKLYFSNL